ncbi:hypothetical protein LTR16_002920 [Cryomyces antarcticus]|uniref:MARVEL domain-containing protein n=1 Tax=Cryomyces antarcticus TaxID=329879 RepID=A0ABR0LYA2_9PEZI|nr:hypothetical protein LTR39_002940 [Cryomyces antarcticus]KAK5256590.1 hypothetical protein LTR16_002920 [Cryomyces antarcticus]
MQIPSYGAAPLSATFLIVRILELISMVAIVGMTANFVAEIVSTGTEPPKEIVGTLSITSIAALYTLLSIPFFWAHANIGLLVMTAADVLLLLAFVIVAVVVGKPLSFLNCLAIDNPSAAVTAAVTAASASAFTQSVTQNLGKSGAALTLGNWAGTTRGNCLETKAIWGFGIALCVLFTTSAVLLPTLWYKSKRASAPGKDFA